MKLGFFEIIVILVVLGLVLISVRGFPSLKRAGSKHAEPYHPRRLTREEAEYRDAGIKARRRYRMRWTGGFFVVAGLLALGYVFRIFDYLFLMSAGAGTIVLAGLAVLMLSFRR